MNITKKGWQKNAAIVMVLLALVGYFILFFQRGTCLYGGFKRKISNEKGFEYHYKYLGSKVDIVVDNTTNQDREISVKYILDGKYENEYKVMGDDLKKVNLGEEVKVFSNYKLLFSGVVHEYGNKPIAVNSQTGGEKLPLFYPMDMSSYGSNVDVRLVITTALGYDVTFRGSFIFLFIGLVLIGLGYLWYRYPSTNFRGTMIPIYVKNPEPTEAYFKAQKISSIIVCVIGIVLMILALFL
ncbi:hypothetical protein SAMN02745248_00928 [Hathewaya proteolytica DSM 3090]|uniref:DUF6199 domain-containing protein n=1 Tax=Hathewaya proteolytica DSM 3090 TaxID=1121331 RepID=A0A1M6M328_9CLOT|nr:hypothetical protein [Hathewaya proteolytica]SHJ77898.1 hypothetical protein SAMN02745248_00928 [Hathewaya proteolytica DSM 3090]